MMTVAELISELRRRDPDLPVVVDGYEDGFADKIKVHDVYLLRDGNGEGGHCGPHAVPFDDATSAESRWDMHAVFIGEGRNLRPGW